MKKISSRLISAILTVIMLFYTLTAAVSFDMSYVTDEGMKLGYSTINGYTKLAFKAGTQESEKIAVYSGLDVTRPYHLFLVGLFYITRGIDLERIMSDNNYAMSVFSDINDYFASKGIENERAANFKNKYLSDKNILVSLDTIGMYIIEESDEYALEIMKYDAVDFVMAGGEIPKNMKDFNFDSKTNLSDAELIKRYITKVDVYKDKDEKNFANFASDINADKKINIMDVTQLQRDLY